MSENKEIIKQANGMRTYRPSFDRYVFSSPEIKQRIDKWVEGVQNKTASRALLLSGNAGLGKTALGLALCSKLEAHINDVREVNCASTRTLEDARDLTSLLRFSPSFGAYRVLILDEVHQMVSNAQQAFLTPIENLEKETILIACTSAPENLNQAFRSRFYEIKLEKYSEEAIIEILENLPLKLKAAQIATIAKAARGNPRKAIDLAEGGAGPGDQHLINFIQNTEKFVPLLLQGHYPMLVLILNQISESEKKNFFETVLGTLEGLWCTLTGVPAAVPLNEQKTITDLIATVKPKVEVVGYFYKNLAALQNKSLAEIKGFIMSLYKG